MSDDEDQAPTGRIAPFLVSLDVGFIVPDDAELLGRTLAGQRGADVSDYSSTPGRRRGRPNQVRLELTTPEGWTEADRDALRDDFLACLRMMHRQYWLSPREAAAMQLAAVRLDALRVSDPTSPIVQDLSNSFRIASSAITEPELVASMLDVARQIPAGMASNAAWELFKLAVFGVLSLFGHPVS